MRNTQDNRARPGSVIASAVVRAARLLGGSA